MSTTTLFETGKLGSLELSNRMVVAPMTRISGTNEGKVGPLMTSYYEAYGNGGFGAVITEGVYPDEAYSQGYINQPGIANQSQAKSWSHLIKTVQATGTKVIMQLMHAGALSQFNRFNTSSRGPSEVLPKGEQMPFYHGAGAYPTPKEMSLSEIAAAITGFVEAARRAQDSGVDGLEVHGANGYLLDQFLTDYANNRQDTYGGSTESRIQLTCEVIERIREAVGRTFTLGVRISQAKVNDFDHKWANGVEDAMIVFNAVTKSGASYIHTTEFAADKPAFGEGKSLAILAREISGLPVIANGSLEEPARALSVVQNQIADFVAIGKGALAAPDWANRVRDGKKIPDFDFGMLSPFADLETAITFNSKK